MLALRASLVKNKRNMAMTRSVQKTEERIYAEQTAILLGEEWDIREPGNEREWPDLLVDSASGTFGLEVRKIYADEASKGSLKRREESLRAERLREVADIYYSGAMPPIRLQFYGDPVDAENLASELASIVPSMQVWERKKVVCGVNSWMYVWRLPDECEEYRKWDIISDRVGWVGVLDPDVVQRAIHRKSSRLESYKKHIEDVRLLLVCDRTMNSGKNLFDEYPNLDQSGFDQIYLLSFPDDLVHIPAAKQSGMPGSNLNARNS